MSARKASLVLMTVLLIAWPIKAITSEVEVSQLLKTTHSWDGVRYAAYPSGQPEVSVLRYSIPAHTSLPWHLHPVISVAYVLSGHLTVVREMDGKSVTLGPGQLLAETVDAGHRGYTNDEAVELIIFYAGTPSIPLTVKLDPNVRIQR